MTHLLDVVVGQGSAILELLTSEDQSLLVRGNALLVLDLGLDIVDRVGGLDLKGDGLARQGLHEADSRISVSNRAGIDVGFFFRNLGGNGICSVEWFFFLGGSLHLHC
jgi:hypothetical protein